MSDPSGILLLMPHDSALDLVQITDPRDVAPELRRELIDCWITVTNTGGAAGFPFPPVSEDDVTPVADKLLSRLDPQQSRLLVARADGLLAGWVVLNRDPYRLVGHWGTVHHLQTRPAFADAASDPPSSTSSGRSPAMSWALNSCTSQPGEERGWRTSTDGSDGERSVVGPRPSDSHPTTPVTRSS